MRVLLAFLFVCLSLPSLAVEWKDYPRNLPQFDYSGDKLKAAWPELTKGTQQEWPDAAFFKRMAEKYPQAHQYTLKQAEAPDAHPALKALAAGNSAPMVEAVQQAWRFHYEGKFKDAYELGMQLGAAGAVPAIYAKLMYSTFMISSPKDKLASFREAAAQSEALLPMTPGYNFAEFGLLYARVRILERLNTAQALATGFLGSTQESLLQFTQNNPKNSLYPTTLGGIQAGVVERVGSLIGRMTYGATATRTIDRFEQALLLEGNLPVIYNEYIVALSRIDADDYQKRIQSLAQKCATLAPFSAEEALNQALCQSTYKTQEQVQEVAANFDH
ncbi:MAG: hypothetical protein RL217_1727 [Pseudomonadota bacterium]|jgi:hypothetical protein